MSYPDDPRSVFLHAWHRIARRNAAVACGRLLGAPEDVFESLDPELLREVWRGADSLPSRDRLEILEKMPADTRFRLSKYDLRALEAQCKRRLGEQLRLLRVLEAWMPAETVRVLKQGIETRIVDHWGHSPLEAVELLPQLPPRLRRQLPRERIREVWQRLARILPVGAVEQLADFPAELAEVVPADDVHALLLTGAGWPLAPRPWYRTGRAPWQTERLPGHCDPDVLRGVFDQSLRDGLRGESLAMMVAVLESLTNLSPLLLPALPVEDIVQAWRRWAAEKPKAALEHLRRLPAACLAEIGPEEVRRIAEPPLRSPDAPPAQLTHWLPLVAALPERLRSWVKDDLLYEVAARVRHGPEPTQMLEIAGALPEEWPWGALDGIAARTIAWRARQWLVDWNSHTWQTAHPEAVGWMLRRYSQNSSPQAAAWIDSLKPEMLALVPQDAVLFVWRRLAVSDGGRFLGNALEWAGADPSELLPYAGGTTPLPLERRPESLRAELRLALLEEIEHEPFAGFTALAATPPEIRPALAPAEIQKLWARMLEDGRPRAALALLEYAPEPALKPLASEADIARLLQSPDADIRLQAIRLLSARPAEQHAPSERADRPGPEEPAAPLPLPGRAR
jgi:hypothetical protein